jgi:hypothetical protein
MPHIFYSKNYVAHFKGNASKEQNAEAHMQKRILVAVPKNIYKNLLCVIAIGQTVHNQAQKPCAHEPLESVRGDKYICVFLMDLHKSNLLQYSFTLGTSCK